MLPVLPPLTYGQVKANRAAVDALTAPAPDLLTSIENASAFLLLSPTVTQEQLDAESPVDILTASMALFSATFSRPEATAKVEQNP
jgi:hypothetical protein